MNKPRQKVIPDQPFENNSSAKLLRAMTIPWMILWLATLLMVSEGAFGQGFVNLDFEEATIAPTPVGGSTFPADPAQTFPGWRVGGPNTSVMYNSVSLGGPAVSLMGPEFPNFVHYLPLQGLYSVQMYYFSALGVPTLSQTGMVPADAQSINFLVGLGETDGVVTLGGVPIPLVPIGGGRFAGDVTSFAGTSVQLTFSTPDIGGYPGQFFYFDDIHFSSSPIPEPSSCSLLLVAGLLLGLRTKRPNKITPHNAGWLPQFRFAVSVYRSGVCEFKRWPRIP